MFQNERQIGGSARGDGKQNRCRIWGNDGRIHRTLQPTCGKARQHLRCKKVFILLGVVVIANSCYKIPSFQ